MVPINTIIKEQFLFNNLKIAICESEQETLDACNITQNTVNVTGIDTRILTKMFKMHDADVDYTILVYDYDLLNQDDGIKRAIIYHELGHILYPSGANEFQMEMNCDKYAIDHVGAEDVYRMIDFAYNEVIKLEDEKTEMLLFARKAYVRTFL